MNLSAYGSLPGFEIEFVEDTMLLAKMHFFNSNPNLEYLLFRFPERYITMHNSMKFSELPVRIHPNGWKENKVELSEQQRRKRTQISIDLHKKTLFNVQKPSTSRLNYLKKTIQLLQQYGNVCMVRMPVNHEWQQIEAEYWPDFDASMHHISNELNIPYFNLIDSCPECTYRDGQHLQGSSAEAVSGNLARKLSGYQWK